MGTRSPQRKGAITPSSPEIYYTPPLTPPTAHHLHIHHPTPEHEHSILTSTATLTTSHTTRPLTTTRSRPLSESLSNTAFDYLESRAKIHHHRTKSPLLIAQTKGYSHHHASTHHANPLSKSPHPSPKIIKSPSRNPQTDASVFLSPYYTPKHNASLLSPEDAIMNFQSNSHQNLLSKNQTESATHLKREKT